MILLILLILALQETPVQARQTTTDRVASVEQRFTAALMKKDDATFAELLADDLVHIGFEGQIVGKVEYLTFFKQGSWQYKKYEPTNVVMKELGNTAVVTGRVDRTIVIDGKEISGAFAFTHVWTKTGNHWRLSSSQLTTISNPPS